MALGMKNLLEKYTISGTWLSRYDALCDPKYVKFCKELRESHEVGLWFEVTSSHAEASGVQYRFAGKQGSWFEAQYCLTLGYTQDERVRLIDSIMRRYFEIFEAYPATVAMWMLDSFSADYMAKRYGVKAIGLCRNQYGVDGYTLWGGWPNLVFYPSRRHIWQPASSVDSRAEVFVFPMMSVDLVCDYSNDFGFWSTEVPAAVWLTPSEPQDAIVKYLNPLVESLLRSEPVGLASFVAENSWDWKHLAPGYEAQMAHLAELVRQGRARSVTVGCYSEEYRRAHPELSPTQVLYEAPGLLNRFPHSAAITACTRAYRARLRADFDGSGLRLTDFRVYDNKLEDPYWNDVSRERFGRWIIPFVLDGSRFQLSGRSELPLADVEANKPAHLSIVASGNERCHMWEKLEQCDATTFRWEEAYLGAELRFENKWIAVSAVPRAQKVAVMLRLVVNPSVLPLWLLHGKERISLADSDAFEFRAEEVTLRNCDEEAQGASLILRSLQGPLDCKWTLKEKEGVLLFGGAKELAIKLIPQIL